MNAKIKDGMKYCNKCSSWKPLEQFSRNKNTVNGYHSSCKACASAAFKARHAANPERYREYNRTNYQRHRNEMLIRARVGYQARREHYREYFRQRGQDPIFKRAENDRRNHRNHLNPEPSRAKARFRKALRRGANGGTPFDRFKIAERDNWTCHLCGLHIELSDF